MSQADGKAVLIWVALRCWQVASLPTDSSTECFVPAAQASTICAVLSMLRIAASIHPR